MRSSVKVKLTARAVKSLPTLWSFWVISSVGGKKSVLDYPPRRGKEDSMRTKTLVLLPLQWRAETRPWLACTQGGSPWICSCWWGGREPFLPTGGTRGQGWSSFAKKGTRVSLAEGRGLPQSVCTFSEAFDSGPNSLSCAKAGAMDGKCLLARLTRSSNRGCWDSARSFPSAGTFSFPSWSEGACQNSNSQGSPQAAAD